jgi:hypothetical protein
MKFPCKLVSGVLCAVALLGAAAHADPGKPNFMPAIYADGEAWGTKGTTTLPAPNPHNLQSYDALYLITNSNNPMEQLPVAEAAPGNPDYNGGRWALYTVMWTDAGFAAHGIVPVLKSLDDIEFHESLGHLMVMAGAPPNGDGVYFQCPLLPTR